MPGTNLFSKISDTLQACLIDEAGLIYFAKCTGVPPTTANIFAKGALIVQTDSASGSSGVFENVGTSASPVWNVIGNTTALRTKTVSVVISPLPAPTGADQLNVDRRLFSDSQAITVVSAKIISSVATSGSGATNQYQFVLRNSTQSKNLGSATTNTNGAELAADTPKDLTVDQNQDLAANDVLVLRTSVKDDGGGGPTNLSSATVKVEVEYLI